MQIFISVRISGNIKSNFNFKVIFISKVTHPYGLALLDDFVFWTEQQKGLVRGFNLNTKNETIQSIENPPLFDLKVFNERKQEGKKCDDWSKKC